MSELLRNNCGVIEFSPPIVRVSISGALEESHLHKAAKLLSDWTSEPWQFIVEHEKAGLTEANRQKQELQDFLKEVKTNPDYEEILKLFPDTKILDITTG